MNIYDITCAYYSKWLGVEPELLTKQGIFWIYNPQRNIKPKGYADSLDIYSYVTDNTIIISYGDKVSDKIPEVKKQVCLGMNSENLRSIFKDTFFVNPNYNIKYVLKKIASIELSDEVRKLSQNDFPLYLIFFKNAHPNCKDTSWVEEYFNTISKKGLCHGVLINGQLVSVTDAPDMPFMSSQVQEIGINTLPAFQKQGYAIKACVSCINEMIKQDICPQWSTTIDNIGSQKLALSIGFVKLFDNISLSI